MDKTGINWNFKMFYDGACPFCMREVSFLKKKDTQGRISFEDTSKPDFDRAQFGITDESNRIIHGMLPDGTIVKGVEVFRRAYKEIGFGWLAAPTGWPILRPIFDRLYLIFAKYRIPLGKLLGRKCDSNTCE